MKDEWKKKNWLNIRMIRKTILDLLRVSSNACRNFVATFEFLGLSMVINEWNGVSQKRNEKMY